MARMVWSFDGQAQSMFLLFISVVKKKKKTEKSFGQKKIQQQKRPRSVFLYWTNERMRVSV